MSFRKIFWGQALGWRGIACCVAHLRVQNFIEQYAEITCNTLALLNLQTNFRNQSLTLHRCHEETFVEEVKQIKNTMEFEIHQEQTAIVISSGKIFLTVKKTQRWNLISKFYKEDVLILEARKSSIAPITLSIIFQNLPDIIDIVKVKRRFYLYAGQQEMCMKIRYFRKPHFVFYLNGDEVGMAKSKKFINIGNTEFRISIDSTNENINLYFVLLFLLWMDPINAI